MDPADLDQDILDFYTDGFDEDARLRSGAHQVELLRTQELIRRHLPMAGTQRVLDVGGGSGVHAEWLLDDGQSVRLLDPVPRHVDIARACRTLHGGQHRNPETRSYFTTSFYHHPDELEAEAVEAGWRVRALLNIEGFAGPGPQTESQWSDPSRREAILEIARLSESDPSLRGLGPHLRLVAEIEAPPRVAADAGEVV